MTAATSLPLETPHQESTPEKVIRVPNSSAHGGFAMIPHSILSRAMSELRGVHPLVFLFVWEKTVSFRKFEAEIAFPEFVRNISYQERSIRDAILWLDENGWLSVRKNGSRPSIYGIAMQVLEEAHCLAYLLTDGGESPSVSPVAKVAKLNSPPPCIPPKALRSLNKHTHNTPVNECIPEAEKNDAEPAAEGCEGYTVSQPKIPGQEPENCYRTYFDPHAEIPEPEPQAEYEGYLASQPKIEIPDHPVAEKLKYCGVHRRNIVKLMSQHNPENISAVVENFERDMGQKHNVRDFAGVLVWRIRKGITTWERDSWVSDVQREFDESVKCDKTQLLGVVERAARRQNLDVQEVLSKLNVQGITCQDIEKFAAVDLEFAS